MRVFLIMLAGDVFFLILGIGVGRHLNDRDRRECDRLLDEADSEIAGLHALGRIHANGN